MTFEELQATRSEGKKGKIYKAPPLAHVASYQFARARDDLRQKERAYNMLDMLHDVRPPERVRVKNSKILIISDSSAQFVHKSGFGESKSKKIKKAKNPEEMISKAMGAKVEVIAHGGQGGPQILNTCLLYTSPSPRD